MNSTLITDSKVDVYYKTIPEVNVSKEFMVCLTNDSAHELIDQNSFTQSLRLSIENIKLGKSQRAQFIIRF